MRAIRIIKRRNPGIVWISLYCGIILPPLPTLLLFIAILMTAFDHSIHGDGIS